MATDLRKQCAAEIKKLLPNLSGTDKNEALTVCKISRPTLDKIIKGNISNQSIDKALELLDFFRGKVDARTAQLERA